jgi:hypothetical protein
VDHDFRKARATVCGSNFMPASPAMPPQRSRSD